MQRVKDRRYLYRRGAAWVFRRSAPDDQAAVVARLAELASDREDVAGGLGAVDRSKPVPVKSKANLHC